MKYPCTDCLVEAVCSKPCKPMVLFALNINKGVIETSWIDNERRAERLMIGILQGARVPQYTFDVNDEPMLQQEKELSTQERTIEDAISLDNEILAKIVEIQIGSKVNENTVRYLLNKSKMQT